MLTVGILCGGFGTRMGVAGRSSPKALFEVSGKPILGHILDALNTLEGPVQTLIVSNTVFAGSFESWAQTRTSAGRPVSVLNNGVTSVEKRLGSIGDMQFIVKHSGPPSELLIIGSDNLFRFSLQAFLKFARPRGPAVVVHDLGSLSEAKRFGVVTMDASGQLLSFEEKPEQPKSSLIATCIYYFPAGHVPRIRAYLDSGQNPDRAGSLIAWLLGQTPVYGWRPEGPWYDIGSPEALAEAQRVWK
ncbi:MAG: NTP transferase domain-containing protein [Planctomycetes bacterium]|nr:NTP transferase domain-containing protein [Planctomycetota bacterium]